MEQSRMQGVIAKTANAVATPTKRKSLTDLIKQMEPEIKRALPAVITPERFTRMVLSAISSNPTLQDCTPKSFLGAMMQAAQLGVEPNTPLGQAYLIPYRNKGELEVQFQLGYKGLIDLAYRSGDVITVYAQCVYENDTFSYEFGLNPDIKHKPCASGNRGALTYVYAVFRTKDGGYGFDVMSVADINHVRDTYSKAAKSGFSPWATNFEEMAKKTVIKRVLKYAPLKTEFLRGVTADETVKSTVSDDMYSVPDETEVPGEFTDTEQPASTQD